MEPLLVLVLGLVLAAEFVNGWTDAPNSIATVVSTRVLTPFKALVMASALNALGAMSGTARLQIPSAAFMAFSHGSNDGQKFIGAFTLALVLGGILPEFQVPLWVILLCAATMGVGTAIGGWRIVKTMGLRLTKLEPVLGFAAETAAASAIELASRLRIPLSTTHTISTSIMGVGSTRRLSAVRWGVGGEIVSAWILTFPVCGLIAWSVAKALTFLP